MKRDDYVNANRAVWNESALLHEQSRRFKMLLRGFQQPGYSSLDDVQTEWLGNVGVEGKSVAQLCCNNGTELLSIKNMGADQCVGFDISDQFLSQARRLAEAGGLECQFVETDIYKIPESFNQQFDLCVITIGVFGWMPDIGLFFDVIDRLLKPGGKLLVHEEHPVMNMLEPWGENPFELVESYFRSQPFEETGLIVYDGEEAGSSDTHYWFVHPLSEIMSQCLDHDMTIEVFREYPFNISNVEYDIYEKQSTKLPMSYILIATK